MNFNYHAWATRHTSGNKRHYRVSEHVLYLGVSATIIAVCIAAALLGASALGAAMTKH